VPGWAWQCRFGNLPLASTSNEVSLTTDLAGLAVGMAIGLLVAWLYFVIWKLRYTASIREDAVQRSQAVTAGKVHEQLIPYLPAFPFNPKDVRFLGSPIDLVVFDGLAEGRVRRVVFLEVKTGSAGLTSRERCVREVIQAGEVEWAELRVRGTSGDPRAAGRAAG
jgi:Holliday junction resolvase-like endonuclease